MTSISTSPAIQASATTTLTVTGVGTNFNIFVGALPVTASSGTIGDYEVVSETVLKIMLTAPAGPSNVTLTDIATGATCIVLVTSLPILELIRQDLVAAVEKISQASGYFTTPTVQELMPSNANSDSLIVIGLGESELVKPPVQKIDWRQTFYALAYVLPSDDQVGKAATVDPRLAYLFADVFKAVYVDRTRGGRAIDTVVQPPSFESNAAEAQFRVIIPIHVHYRTLESDPTVQG